MEFHGVLELAKRAEHAVEARMNHTKGYVNGPTSQSGGSKPNSDTSNTNPKFNGKFKVNHEMLKERELEFLTININRGGGPLIYENRYNKLEWI